MTGMYFCEKIERSMCNAREKKKKKKEEKKKEKEKKTDKKPIKAKVRNEKLTKRPHGLCI